MNTLPDHLLRDCVSLLPQVDLFRLIRVSRRFEQFLRPRLANLTLNELELVRQFRERNLGPWGYQTVALKIVEKYGSLFARLDLVLFYRSFRTAQRNNMDKELVLRVANNCPNLEELALTYTHWRSMVFEYPAFEFPATFLPKLPNLKVLRAKLAYHPDRTVQLDTIVQRMLAMNKISCFDLDNNDIRDGLRAHGVPIAALTGVCLPSWTPYDSKLFPSIEAIVLKHRLSNPGYAFIPASLTQLSLIQPITTITVEDLEPLKRLDCLTEFQLNDQRGEIKNFQFLCYFDKLQHFGIHFSTQFDADAFALIPAAAPLTSVQIEFCPAVCNPVMDSLLARGNRLTHISLGPIPTLDEAGAIGQLLADNCDTLTEVNLISYDAVTDTILEQLTDRSILRLADLSLVITKLTAPAVRQLLRRRRRLIHSASGQTETIPTEISDSAAAGVPNLPLMPVDAAAGLAMPRSLMRIVVYNAVAVELSSDDQLVSDAMVIIEAF